MYYLVYGSLYLISLLPLRILYFFSDFAYFNLYYVFGYRKKVVMDNLRNAFPEKTEIERQKIAKKFYRNLTDTFLESIKLISIPEKRINRHVDADLSVLERLHREGRKCQLHLGHNFNWELASFVFPLRSQFLYLAVYMPIGNKVVDRIFLKIRQRTGGIFLPATNMREAIAPYRDKQYLLALVADQNPGHPGNAYWFNFFGRPTPFLKAPEKAARNFNIPVVFAYIHKNRRGHYDAALTLAHENPSELPEAELTRQYVKYLQQVITQYPDMWLWSHRRWKWEWKEEYGPVL